MLTETQRKIVKALTYNRSETSFYAGGAMINLETERMSQDLDIFHPSNDECHKSYLEDIKVLQATGFIMKMIQINLSPFFCKMEVVDGEASTVIDWAVNSKRRFFPVQKYDSIGHVLHECDLLIGKLLACANRQAVRDYYDICRAWSDGRPLLECLLAAPGVDKRYNAFYLLNFISQNVSYEPEMFFSLKFEPSYSEDDYLNLAAQCGRIFFDFTQKANAALQETPISEMGFIFLDQDADRPVLPLQDNLKEGRLIKIEARQFLPVISSPDPTEDENISFGYRL
jgi:hypothetical protein